MRQVFVALLWVCLSCSFIVASRAADVPLGEHPRPDFRRDTWQTLNGPWQFRFDAKNQGLKAGWSDGKTEFDRQIVVPYAWESQLSGIHEPSGQYIGWYRRTVDIPAAWKGQRVWLHLGAVDWQAQVWVNGQSVAVHQGGFTPLSVDITRAATTGESAVIVVRAYDPTHRELPNGSQLSGHTTTSGIWQTVWLEARRKTHIASARLVPREIAGEWHLDVELEIADVDGPATVRMSSPSPGFPEQRITVRSDGPKGRATASFEITQPKLWSPQTPHLYDLRLDLKTGDETDTVHTYFGLRTVRRGKFANAAHESILLNGRPIYLRGALDQGFYPDGIYTPASDEAVQHDLTTAKRLGVNCLRMHAKAVAPRRLYWADRLGLLVIQDIPGAGDWTSRARGQWRATLRDVIARDRNHPSIICWNLFDSAKNLTGKKQIALADDPSTQRWVAEVWTEVKKKLDPTRLVDDHCSRGGGHVRTDVNSWNFVMDDYAHARVAVEFAAKQTFPGSTFNFVPGIKQRPGPLVVTDFAPFAGKGADRDVSWSLRYLITQLRRHDKIQGYAYRMLYDVEWEHNGLLNYDRSAKAFGYDGFVQQMTLADLQGDDFVGFDTPPVMESVPGGEVSLPVFVSHFSRRTEPPKLRWWISGVDNLARRVATKPVTLPVIWRPYRTTYQKLLRLKVPAGAPFVGAVCLELVDARGERIAANYVNLLSRQLTESVDPKNGRRIARPSPRVEVVGRRTVALRFQPSDFAQATGDTFSIDALKRGEKVFSQGACRVQYRVKLPAFVIEAVPTRLTVLAEFGSKAGTQRNDWPQTAGTHDYPQTQQRKHPGRVAIRLFDKQLWQLQLPDDPADSRGVLSHYAQYHPGSFGYLARKQVDLVQHPTIPDKLRVEPVIPITFESRAGQHAGGVSLYGERLGRFVIDPTLLIQTARDLTHRVGWSSNEPVTVDRAHKKNL